MARVSLQGVGLTRGWGPARVASGRDCWSRLLNARTAASWSAWKWAARSHDRRLGGCPGLYVYRLTISAAGLPVVDQVAGPSETNALNCRGVRGPAESRIVRMTLADAVASSGASSLPRRRRNRRWLGRSTPGRRADWTEPLAARNLLLGPQGLGSPVVMSDALRGDELDVRPDPSGSGWGRPAGSGTVGRFAPAKL